MLCSAGKAIKGVSIMLRKFNKLAKQFKGEGFNTLVTYINGQITLSVWKLNHKPGDDATDIFYEVSSSKLFINNGLNLSLPNLG